MSHSKNKKYFQAPFLVLTIVVLPGADPILLPVTSWSALKGTLKYVLCSEFYLMITFLRPEMVLVLVASF